MAEVVVPRAMEPGSPEQIAADIEVARKSAGYVDDDARPLVRCYRALRDSKAHEKWQADKPRTWEQFCREALGYEAAFLEEIEEGVSILEGEGHNGAISKEQARARSSRERVRTAALETNGVVLPGDGSVHPGNARQFAGHTQGDRAGRNGVGERTQRKLDRLARDFPDLLSKVQSGELTATAADRLASGKPKHISVLVEPASAAETIRRHFSTEQVAELVRLLEGEVG